MEIIELFGWEKPNYAKEEALRTLRTNIRFCGDSIKSILLTSFAPTEGKSTIALSLAHSLAESGRKVLLIDADIRKSVMVGKMRAKSLSGAPLVGLSHFLTGQKTKEEVICEVRDLEKLHIIFAGPAVPNPTEILEEHYFDELMEYAREEYDMVIVDSAPIGLVIDAAVIARNCDGAILVIAQGEVKRGQILSAKNQLAASGIRILGAVLNKIDVSKSSYYGKYYGRYEQYGRVEIKDSKESKDNIG